MARIFLVLALLAVALLIANAVLGFWIGDYNGAWQRYRAAHTPSGVGREPPPDSAAAEAAKHELDTCRDRKVTHFLLGLTSTLVTLLVNSITVTYFVGTSRWCKEVVDTYQLDEQLAQRSTILKRQAFPWALLGILVMMGIVVLGVCCDPAGPFPDTTSTWATSSAWVTPHMMAALLGTGVIAWAFAVQMGKIGANYEVIEEIVAEVRRIRAERGLDVEPAAEDGS